MYEKAQIKKNSKNGQSKSFCLYSSTSLTETTMPVEIIRISKQDSPTGYSNIRQEPQAALPMETE